MPGPRHLRVKVVVVFRSRVRLFFLEDGTLKSVQPPPLRVQDFVNLEIHVSEDFCPALIVLGDALKLMMAAVCPEVEVKFAVIDAAEAGTVTVQDGSSVPHEDERLPVQPMKLPVVGVSVKMTEFPGMAETVYTSYVVFE